MPWSNAPADGSAESEASRRHRGPAAEELVPDAVDEEPAKDPYPLGAPEPEPEPPVLTPKERKAQAAALKAARQRAEKAAKAAQKEAIKAHKQAVKAHTKLKDGTEPPPPPDSDVSAFVPPEEASELKALGWVMGAGGAWEEAPPDSARSSNASSAASRRRQEWATGMPEIDASAILPDGDAEGDDALLDPEEAERLAAMQAEAAALEEELRAGVAACREAGDAALLAGDFAGATAAYRSGLELDPESGELSAAIETVEVKKVEAAARDELRAGGSLVVGELVLDGLWRSSVEGALIAVRPRALTAPHSEAQFIGSGTTYPLQEHDGVCSMGPWTLSLERSDSTRLMWEKDKPPGEEPEPEPEPEVEPNVQEPDQPNWGAESEANASMLSDASVASDASVYVDPRHLSYGTTILSDASVVSESDILSDDDDVDPNEPRTPAEVARRRSRGRHVPRIENNAPVIPPDGDWDLAGRYRWNMTGPTGEKVALDSIANSERKAAGVVDWLEEKGYDKTVAKLQERWTGESQIEALEQLQVAKAESSIHATKADLSVSGVDESGASGQEDEEEVDPLSGDITWEFLGDLDSGSHFPDAIAKAFIPPPKTKRFAKPPPPSTVERLHLNGCGIDDEACAGAMRPTQTLISISKQPLYMIVLVLTVVVSHAHPADCAHVYGEFFLILLVHTRVCVWSCSADEGAAEADRLNVP
jgi:hypothetical protein